MEESSLLSVTEVGDAFMDCTDRPSVKLSWKNLQTQKIVMYSLASLKHSFVYELTVHQTQRTIDVPRHRSRVCSRSPFFASGSHGLGEEQKCSTFMRSKASTKPLSKSAIKKHSKELKVFEIQVVQIVSLHRTRTTLFWEVRFWYSNHVVLFRRSSLSKDTPLCPGKVPFGLQRPQRLPIPWIGVSEPEFKSQQTATW